MKKQQYELLTDDLKLDARLAIVLGKEVDYYDIWGLLVSNESWQPSQDPAILMRLLNSECILGMHQYKDKWCVTALSKYGDLHYAESKLLALIAAYCAADPRGHWAKWCKDNGVIV
jgi:hypothetical protein